MYRKVRSYILENNMIQKNDCVLAGVSGGGDSMTMLHMLLRLSREYDFFLQAVHVHHGIRGEEADRDAALVEHICREWKIPFVCRRYDIPALAAQWKMGLEETGRIVRQRTFEEEAAKFPQKQCRIALAHNQDDLAETLLHHLARGSGIRGLCSMRAVSGRKIRPLLCLRREEIDHYLIENHIPYATDSSNLTDLYTRNKIRHKILPLVEEINPKACIHMAETARVLALAEDYFTKKGRELFEDLKKTDGGVLLDMEFFRKDPILVSYGILEAFRSLSGKQKDFLSAHVQRVLSLGGKHVGYRCSLPYGLVAIRRYEGVWIGRPGQMKATLYLGQEWEISREGEIGTPLGTFETKIFCYKGEEIPEKTYTKWFDYDKIKYRLFARTRREGDLLTIDQQGNHKKITRVMIDEKIPKEERDLIPLLTCAEEVLWIVGIRSSEQYKITKDTKRVLEVKYQGGSLNERENQSFDQ